jgi:hypothetical protein
MKIIQKFAIAKRITESRRCRLRSALTGVAIVALVLWPLATVYSVRSDPTMKAHYHYRSDHSKEGDSEVIIYLYCSPSFEGRFWNKLIGWPWWGKYHDRCPRALRRIETSKMMEILRSDAR